MKLNSPKQITWIIALIVGLVAILGVLVTIPFVSANAFWVMAVGWALLVLATALKGL